MPLKSIEGMDKDGDKWKLDIETISSETPNWLVVKCHMTYQGEIRRSNLDANHSWGTAMRIDRAEIACLETDYQKLESEIAKNFQVNLRDESLLKWLKGH